jgi:hypothetical protein
MHHDLIHPSAWKVNSANFAIREFSEVAPDFVTLHTWLRYVTQRGRRVPPSLKEVG